MKKSLYPLLLVAIFILSDCKKPEKEDNTPKDESPDFVTFSDGNIPENWITNTWIVENTLGYDDNYSLKSTPLDVSSVLTYKTLNAPGYLEFYTRGGSFELFIDTEKATALSSVSMGNNWNKWMYALYKGRHSIRWEATGQVVFLDAVKFALAKLPKVDTKEEVTNITASSATSGGYVNDDGNSPVTARGVCWSTSENPTINDNKTVDGSGMGTFTSNITELNLGTYFVRAYATNSVGTAYGEQKSFSTKLVIGDKYQGGKIAYIDHTGEHGFIISSSYYGSWYIGPSINIGDTETEIGTGRSNTKRIVQVLGQGYYAASICDELTLGGYNDWYLPSRGELFEIRNNLIQVENYTDVYNYYWSSSESGISSAFAVDFKNGSVFSYPKSSDIFIRCIRDF